MLFRSSILMSSADSDAGPLPAPVIPCFAKATDIPRSVAVLRRSCERTNRPLTPATQLDGATTRLSGTLPYPSGFDAWLSDTQSVGLTKLKLSRLACGAARH